MPAIVGCRDWRLKGGYLPRSEAPARGKGRRGVLFPRVGHILFGASALLAAAQIMTSAVSGQETWIAPDGTAVRFSPLVPDGRGPAPTSNRPRIANLPRLNRAIQPQPTQGEPPVDTLADDLLGDAQTDLDADLGVLDAMGPNDEPQLPGAGHGKDDAQADSYPDGLDPHAEVFAENCYPSAMTCAKCHKKIYDEWRVSAHAYSAISPMFHRFEQKITALSQGTVGTFCLRCHAPVATQMNLPRDASIVDAPYVMREGVTCVACHRVKEAYGRVHGERRIEPGPLQAPVYGGIGGEGIAKAIADKDNYKIKLDPTNKGPGQEIHLQGIKFEQLHKSDFCHACHQVAVHPGISLEVVWAQYRAGPACKKGISCQDCHMGLVPGKPFGYARGPAAEMSGKTVNEDRQHSNHMFFGPGNSIAHPGLFPHNEKGLRWTVDQWLEFDWRAGWGTKAFRVCGHPSGDNHELSRSLGFNRRASRCAEGTG